MEKGYQSKYLAYDGERGKARVAVLSKTLNKLCRKCGMEEFNTHIIRKSFASALSKCPVFYIIGNTKQFPMI